MAWKHTCEQGYFHIHGLHGSWRHSCIPVFSPQIIKGPMKAAVYKSFGAWGDRVRFATDWCGSCSDICFPLLLAHYHAQIIVGCILRLWLCYILFILCISYKYCTKNLCPGQIIFVAGVILHTKKKPTNGRQTKKHRTREGKGRQGRAGWANTPAGWGGGPNACPPQKKIRPQGENDSNQPALVKGHFAYNFPMC